MKYAQKDKPSHLHPQDGGGGARSVIMPDMDSACAVSLERTGQAYHLGFLKGPPSPLQLLFSDRPLMVLRFGAYVPSIARYNNRR